MPGLWWSSRWYLRRAPAGYLREGAAGAELIEGLAETVEGARTIEVLGWGERRRARTDADIVRAYAAERYTLHLRTVYFPIVDSLFVLPVAAMLLIGGWLYTADLVTLAQLTAATLYTQQLIEPLDRFLGWLDELQVGGASLARLLGVAQVPDDRTPGDDRPADERLAAADVRYSYVDGRDVLHGIDVAVRPGGAARHGRPVGRRQVDAGPAARGHRAATHRLGAVGDVPLVDLPLDDLRGHVALVTQEHHVFGGTVRENVALARPEARTSRYGLRWRRSTPSAGSTRYRPGWTPRSVPAGCRLTPARRSNSPWPGWSWPTRTRSCWTRRPR